ncbi:hypothetical protein Tco_0695955 [Tanacetum coccineum]
MSRQYGYMLRHMKQSFMPRKDFREMAAGLKLKMKKVFPSMADKKVNEIAKKTVPLYVAEGLLLDRKKTQTNMATMIAEVIQKERETLRAELSTSSSTQDLQYQLYLKMNDDEQVRNADLSIWWSLEIKFEKHAPHAALCRIVVVRTRDHEDHHDNDARPEEESSAKRQKTSDHETYSLDGFGTDDDEVPSEEVSQELLEEISGEVDKAQIQKAVNDMLREKKDNPDEVYLVSKIEEVVRTLYELGHEHKYITEIVVRRADGKFGAFSESDYKHLHKNDIEDLYLMCINGKVKDYRETGLKKLLTITSKPVVGSIYENIKKEKRVLIIKEIPKFCDATLRRVLKLVEKKNMDVKHGYEDPKLSDNDAEYLRFYEEYIKHRLRHRD